MRRVRCRCLAAALVALACAWSLNLYNFMDGSDGLAAAMTLVGFAAYGAALLANASSARAAAVRLRPQRCRVLAVNRPPARMFLGDVGAVPLGFLAAALGIGGDRGRPVAPVVSTPRVPSLRGRRDGNARRRVIARERFWESHRSHYYQRLHQLGAGTAEPCGVWVALMAGSAGTAVACACLAPEWGTAALARVVRRACGAVRGD